MARVIHVVFWRPRKTGRKIFEKKKKNDKLTRVYTHVVHRCAREVRLNNDKTKNKQIKPPRSYYERVESVSKRDRKNTHTQRCR